MTLDPRPTAAGGVAVVGSITTDVSVISERMPLDGETILGSEAILALGGKGANQAVAAARAGTRTHLIGCIGEDMFGSFVTAELRKNHVDSTGVRVCSARTGIAHIRIDSRGENSIVMVPLANASLTVEQATESLHALQGSATVLLTQLEIDPDVCLSAIRAAQQLGLTVVLDPAPAVPIDEEVWTLVHVVTPNETEAAVYSGITVTDTETAAAAGRWFCDRGTPYALITLAGRGAVLVTAESVATFPAMQVEVVDSTAAGDAFTGYLGAALAAGRPLADAVPRAMAASALAVTRPGASPSIPSFAEVDTLLTGVGAL